MFELNSEGRRDRVPALVDGPVVFPLPPLSVELVPISWLCPEMDARPVTRCLFPSDGSGEDDGVPIGGKRTPPLVPSEFDGEGLKRGKRELGGPRPTPDG